jgi:hypothetical protein
MLNLGAIVAMTDERPGWLGGGEKKSPTFLMNCYVDGLPCNIEAGKSCGSCERYKPIDRPGKTEIES